MNKVGKKEIAFLIIAIFILSLPFTLPLIENVYVDYKIRSLLFPYYDDMVKNPQYYKVSEVRGTSMYPLMEEGDLVVIMLKNHPEFNVSVGDVVVYIPISRIGVMPYAEYYVEKRVFIAHRVLSKYDVGSRTFYLVKGDNNPIEDPWTITDDDIIGKVVKIIPKEQINSEIKQILIERW